MAGLIDTHLHLARDEFKDDREEVRRRSLAAGVRGFVHVGYDRDSIEGALAAAASHGDSWCTAGIHPHDAESYDDEAEALLAALGEAGRIIAIGECGLDFFRDLSPRDSQRVAFRRQIELAKRLELPMVFHVRDAYDEARTILLEEGLPPRRGIFHAFASDGEFAGWAVSEGFKLGIGGPLTYKKAHLPEAIEGLPAESFLLETDAPWLPPQPWRGKRNEPAYLRHTADRLAAICGLELDALAEVQARVFCELFAVELSPDFLQSLPSKTPSPGATR